jgi:NAD(P)-dependent dehydrogenase (short-subunit alcohol dehydrogenase family)
MNSNFKTLFDLENKVALITGGGGNLGPYFGLGLSQYGAKVALIDVNQQAVDEATDQINSAGGEALGIVCDITDPTSVSDVVGQVTGKFGRIDILHNNAASKTDDLAAYLASMEDYSLDTWKKVMDVNINAMFVVAQAVGKVMIEQGDGGSIIQTSTHYALNGPDFSIYEGSYYMGMPISQPPVYATSKAAVIGLTRYLASYWGGHNIRVNTLVPGGVSTGQNNEFHDRYAKNVPLGRMARIEDMVGAVIYLASDASAYVTGQELVVDGGWTIR